MHYNFMDGKGFYLPQRSFLSVTTDGFSCIVPKKKKKKKKKIPLTHDPVSCRSLSEQRLQRLCNGINYNQRLFNSYNYY